MTPSSYIKTLCSLLGNKLLQEALHNSTQRMYSVHNHTFIMVQSSANTMRQCSRRSNPPTPQTTQGQQHKSIPPPLKKKFSELAFTIVTVKLEMLELVLVSSPELWPIHYHCLCDKEMRIICSQSMPLKKDHGQYLLVNLF